MKVYSTVRTAQQVLDDYNAWLLVNKDVLTATEGGVDYLTDDDGVYLTAD